MSRPRTRPLPSVAELREIYRYDPETGDLIFNRRPSGARINASWNARYADKVAGTIMNAGYRFVSVYGQTMLAHRVSWALYHGEWPASEIDHRDGNKLNNTILNLRVGTHAENCSNRPGRSSCGFKGVHANKRTPNRWGAKITIGGVSYWLGTFGSPTEAHAAYVGASRVLHRDFGHTGVVVHGTICATIRITAVAA